jgi:hypothetical protein
MKWKRTFLIGETIGLQVKEFFGLFSKSLVLLNVMGVFQNIFSVGSFFHILNRSEKNQEQKNSRPSSNEESSNDAQQ